MMRIWSVCGTPGCHRLLTSLETIIAGLCDEHLIERDLEQFADSWQQRTGERLTVAELRKAAEEQREPR